MRESSNEKTCSWKQDSLLMFAVPLDSAFVPGTCYTLSSLRVQGTVPRDPVSACQMDEPVDKLKLLTAGSATSGSTVKVPESIVIHSKACLLFLEIYVLRRLGRWTSSKSACERT